MAWTTPKTWVQGEVVTAADFNAELRDRFNLLEVHDHSETGLGSDELGGATGLTLLRLAEYTTESEDGLPPTPSSGAIAMFKDGSALKVIYDDGTVRTVTTSPHGTTHDADGNDPLEQDGIASKATLRSLGSGAQQAAAGNHGHVFSGVEYPLKQDVGDMSYTLPRTGNTNVSEVLGGSAGAIQIPTSYAGSGFLVVDFVIEMRALVLNGAVAFPRYTSTGSGVGSYTRVRFKVEQVQLAGSTQPQTQYASAFIPLTPTNIANEQFRTINLNDSQEEFFIVRSAIIPVSNFRRDVDITLSVEANYPSGGTVALNNSGYTRARANARIYEFGASI